MNLQECVIYMLLYVASLLCKVPAICIHFYFLFCRVNKASKQSCCTRKKLLKEMDIFTGENYNRLYCCLSR